MEEVSVLRSRQLVVLLLVGLLPQRRYSCRASSRTTRFAFFFLYFSVTSSVGFRALAELFNSPAVRAFFALLGESDARLIRWLESLLDGVPLYPSSSSSSSKILGSVGERRGGIRSGDLCLTGDVTSMPFWGLAGGFRCPSGASAGDRLWGLPFAAAAALAESSRSPPRPRRRGPNVVATLPGALFIWGKLLGSPACLSGVIGQATAPGALLIWGELRTHAPVQSVGAPSVQLPIGLGQRK